MMFWFILALSCNGPVCGIGPYGTTRYNKEADCTKAVATLNKTYKNAHAKCDWGKQ